MQSIEVESPGKNFLSIISQDSALVRQNTKLPTEVSFEMLSTKDVYVRTAVLSPVVGLLNTRMAQIIT